jgi:hypothetical protein
MPVKNNSTVRSAAVIRKEHYLKDTERRKITEGKGCEMPTPNKCKKLPANKIVIDNMDKCIIRRKSEEYYEIHKEMPTLQKLHTFCKTETNFPG